MSQPAPTLQTTPLAQQQLCAVLLRRWGRTRRHGNIAGRSATANPVQCTPAAHDQRHGDNRA